MLIPRTLPTLALMLVALPALAVDSPWNGTWKLNRDKSHTTGDTYTITEKAGDLLTFSDGSAITYDYRCDGKPYPILADRTVTCTGSNASGFDYTYSTATKVLSTSHEVIAADGKTYAAEYASIRPDGSHSSSKNTYQRMSGTTGMVGKWKDIKDKTDSVSIQIITVTDGVMHEEVPSQKQVLDAKLDGTESPVTGPNIPPGAMVSMKLDSPTKLHYKDVYEGKVLVEGTESLSADGRIMTVEEWTPGKMAEKATLIFEKQ